MNRNDLKIMADMYLEVQKIYTSGPRGLALIIPYLSKVRRQGRLRSHDSTFSSYASVASNNIRRSNTLMSCPSDISLSCCIS